MAGSEAFVGSGIGGLDEILGGGFPRGQVHLIRGESGAGKTTLSLQFLIDGARRGERVLYVGTSETEREIRAVAQSHGWSLEGVRLHHHAALHEGGEQTVLPPIEVELPKTMEAILALVEDVAPTRLVIDSLAEIRVLAQEELWYRRQLMSLKQHFADRHCTVLLIEIPDLDQPTLNSIVNGVIELEQVTPLYGPDRRRLRVVKMRAHSYAAGYHDYKIRTGGLEVFPRLTAADHRQSFSREQIGTGLPRLDAMLSGGIIRGTSLLLLGTSGTGKSLMATQLVAAAAQRGERSAMFVFDERIQTLFQRSEGVGLPLRKYVEQGLVQIRQVDPAELTSGELSHIAEHAVSDEGVRILVIDSLNGYAYAMPDERLLSVHLHELASYLSQQAVTSVFTMTQHGLVSDRTSQDFDISYVADTVMLFQHYEFQGGVHKAISVYKNRGGPHETAIREIQIGPEGLRLGEPLTQFRGILTGTPFLVGDKRE